MYLLVECVRYEGDTIIGAYETAARAINATMGHPLRARDASYEVWEISTRYGRQVR